MGTCSVCERRPLTLEGAARQTTDEPAWKVRLNRRGELTEGGFTDEVAFDPAAIRVWAAFEQPHLFAGGVCRVIGDGRVAVRGGTLSSRLVGPLRPPAE